MDKILIVEDTVSLRELLKRVLEVEGFQAHTVESAELATEWLKNNTASLVLADFNLPGKNGMQLLHGVRKVFPTLPYIIMTAYDAIEIAVDALKLGADDFITKPFSPEDLISLVKDVLSPKSRSVMRYAKKEKEKFLTADPVVKNILKEAKKAAPYDSPILILGESGVGKEVLARFIHANSSRADKPFIAVNCGALPETLLESELFGHESRAFTCTTKARKGLFEIASEGTLFLDEVTELSSYLQAKLSRALQDGEIRRIASNKATKVNPRIIAATNKDLKSALKNKSFRKDFYYQISVIEFFIPPLRERPKDIELLIEYALAGFSRKYNKYLSLSSQTKEKIASYLWPGNVRELFNVLERTAILSPAGIINTEYLMISPTIDRSLLKETALTLPQITAAALRGAEVSAIKEALLQTEGNKAKAAKILGISYKTLLNKIKEYDITYSPPSSFRNLGGETY